MSRLGVLETCDRKENQCRSFTPFSFIKFDERKNKISLGNEIYTDSYIIQNLRASDNSINGVKTQQIETQLETPIKVEQRWVVN